jgi:hypothetical protein
MVKNGFDFCSLDGFFTIAITEVITNGKIALLGLVLARSFLFLFLFWTMRLFLPV